MKNYTRISKQLAHFLRHCQHPLVIDLNGGWARVDDLLPRLGLARQELDWIVENDAKTRYAYDESGTRIRANQGHSIPGVVVEMTRPEPPEWLYHGTAVQFLEPILKEGLRPMRRQWVHISPDYETAVRVGSRHGQPVVLRVLARQMTEDGLALYRSVNGVWQAREVPARYLEVMWQP